MTFRVQERTKLMQSMNEFDAQKFQRESETAGDEHPAHPQDE